MAGIKQQPLGQIQLQVPRPTPEVGSSTAALLQGLTPVAAAAGRSVAAREKAQAEAREEELASAVEDSLLDASFSALDEAQAVSQRQEVSRNDLTPGEQMAVSEAQSANLRLEQLEAQQGLSTKVKLQRVKVFREFAVDYPHMRKELRSIFKRLTGKTAVEVIREVEADISKTAADEREALKNRLLSTAKGLGFTPTTESIPELVAMVGPYERQLRNAAEAQRQADMLTNMGTIRREERKVMEESILEEGFGGTLIDQQAVINSLLDGFDPAVVDEDTKAGIIQQLQVNKRAVETSIRDTFRETGTDVLNARLKPILDSYDDAIKVVTGELKGDLLKNNNAIRREAAILGLHNRPGFTDVQTRLEAFRNIPSELISGDQRLALSKGMVQPMLEMLSIGMANPSKNPYSILDASGTAAQIGRQYQALRDVALAELDNNAAAQGLADSLQAWTNEFSQAPDEVPARVLSSMLDVASDPRSINILYLSDSLPHNLTEGFRSYHNRLRGETAAALAEELGVVLPVGEEEYLPGGRVLSFLTGGFTDSLTRTSEQAKLIELVDVNFQRDGKIVFTPKDLPETRGNRQVAIKAQNLTRSLGPVVGKLVRAYAHVINGNTDYHKAAQDLMDAPNWETPLSGVGITGFSRRSQEEQEFMRGEIRRGGQ